VKNTFARTFARFARFARTLPTPSWKWSDRGLLQ
jgi:hypothetical protein